MYDVISIGSATQDIFLETEDFEKIKNNKNINEYLDSLKLESKTEIDKEILEVGGGGTNSAVTFSRLGLKTAFLGIIGNDMPGKNILETLKKEKVSTSLIQTDKNEKTAFSIILLSPHQKRIILVCRNVEENLDLKEKDLEKLSAKWFYITSLAGKINQLKKIINFAFKKEIKILLNPGAKELEKKDELLPLLNKVDVVLLNLDEAKFLTGSDDFNEMFLKIRKYFSGTFIITLGSKGVIVYSGNRIYKITTSPSEKMIDATGAGDAFGSGYLTGIILKNDIKFAMQLGIENARSVITKIGAKEGILTKLPNKFEYQVNVK